MQLLHNSRFARILAVVAIVGVVAGGWILYGLEKAEQAGVKVTTMAPALAQVIDQGAVRTAINRAMPSVVAVTSTKTTKVQQQVPFPFFDFPFGGSGSGQQPMEPQERKQQGLGSGVIVASDGYILTNAHVIDGADEVEVHLQDDRVLEAKIVGLDEGSDIGVLKIAAKDLPVLQLSDSDQAEVGDVVLAIGAPFGLGNTVTMGIISAKGRTMLGITGDAGYEDFIQTDAAINPGNSGGALINMKGELVGVNTAILSRTGGFQGIGLAIPTNLARRVMTSLIENGKVVRGWLGVSIQDITTELAEQFDLPNTKGVLISSVEAGSPAAKAEIKVGQVVLKVNGRAVDDPAALRSVIGTTAPGSRVEIELWANGKSETRTLTIGEAPAEVADANGQPAGPTSDVELLPGLYAANLNAEMREQLGLSKNVNGVVVTRVDADKLKSSMPLQPGDLIIGVNQVKIDTVEQAAQQVKSAQRSNVLLLLQRGRNTLFTTVRK